MASEAQVRQAIWEVVVFGDLAARIYMRVENGKTTLERGFRLIDLAAKELLTQFLICSILKNRADEANADIVGGR
jgi:hypothetical protein